ncbi:MAG: DUF4350 domain-containing protein [Myxococcota bacterium]
MTGVAALLAGLGVVALGFGLLSALLALLQPFTDPLWIAANLVLGVVLLGAAVFMSLDSLRERLRSGGGRRAGKYGTSAIVGTVLGIVILGLFGFLSSRYHHRFDVSEAGVHTLSPQTTELLASLEENVTLTGFFNALQSPEPAALLDRYAFASDRVSVRYVDPNDDPLLVEELGLDVEALSRGVIHIALDSGEQTSLSEFSAANFEPDVTNALVKLVRSAGKKVYFLVGHNERPIAGEAEGETFAVAAESYGRAAAALANETYAVESLLLTSLDAVPDDASAVVAAGPTRPYLPHELAALEAYVAQGGGLFVAIDPRAQTNLYDLASGWGVRFGDDAIIDRQAALFGQATAPITDDYDPAHPITERFDEPTLFPMARSLALDADAAGLGVLVRTGEASWAERSLDASRETGRVEFDELDVPGPVPIAVVGTPGGADPDGAEAAASSGRIVVLGDSDFASNQYLDTLRNKDLFVNAINWLAGDVARITVRPNVSRASSFQMSQDEFRRIQFLSLFVLPEAIAVVGVLTWWFRRKAGAAV